MKPLRYFCLLAAGLALGMGLLSANAFAVTGTAAQYFTQKAVGNTWTYLSTSTCTGAGCPPGGHAPMTLVSTITASANGVVTHQEAYDGYTFTSTEQIDATGAWIWTESDYSSVTQTVLPATFSVGTTWVPYTMTTPVSGWTESETNTIAAFNVTRTVPAGTFTDCLQVDWLYTATFPDGTSTSSGTYYLSPAAGAVVDSNSTSVSTYAGETTTWTAIEQLQSYSIASPTLYTLSVARSGTGSGSIASDTGGISCGASCWADYTSGTTVTLTATPASGSYFYGWSGACSGTSSCVVAMTAAKSVTATFKPTPFVTTTTSIITATSATISTTVSFNPADVGKTGAVYVTSWAPANGLAALGILSAPMSHALNVTVTNDNPYGGGKINTRQESLASILAADANAYVLVQLTSSGWQLVQNGQLIPYASGVLGDALSSLSILNNANPSNLLGAQFCVGYGTSAAEMIASGRMMPVADIPGASATTNGSCNVAANPYKGLWYNPNESGWGMSITQHDTINFVAMYTYDQNAQPIWYVMSNCPIVTAGSCTGDIYKVVGGKPPTASWVNLDFAQALSTVGSGTLTFSDTNNAQFNFTLNGAAGSKIIERQLFSSGTAAQAVDYTDLWWNASESGWGVALTQDVGMLFAAWYTYDAAGQPVWYVASSCPLSGSGCTGDVYKVTGGMPLSASWVNLDFTQALSTVGSVTFTFSDSGTGTMSYTINGVSGSKAITRQAF